MTKLNHLYGIDSCSIHARSRTLYGDVTGMYDGRLPDALAPSARSLDTVSSLKLGVYIIRTFSKDFPQSQSRLL